MIDMGHQEDEALSEAILIWTGWGESSSPTRDPEQLADRLGRDEALDLLPLIRQVEDDFYLFTAKTYARSLAEMGAMAKSDFARMNQGISDEALARCYTFDYK